MIFSKTPHSDAWLQGPWGMNCFIHFFGYYIGHYPSLKSEKIIKIASFLNSLDL